MKALAAFQKECPALRKDSTAKGVKFSYNYASLPVILEVVNPILQKHGLVFAQPLTESGIKTILFHLESGETLESETNIPRVELSQMNAFQSAGCGITYFRRYALCSLLGIVSDDDTDAAGEQKVIKDATTDQVNRINDLLRTSTLDEKGRKDVEDSIFQLSHERANKCIGYLLDNQIAAKDGGGMKLKDINDELDLKMQNERQ
ncbi:MAG TPA: ERF family protein [Bacteroidales bacterium]|nr:ERF family protein [Bacteroidales bacterium]